MSGPDDPGPKVVDPQMWHFWELWKEAPELRADGYRVQVVQGTLAEREKSTKTRKRSKAWSGVGKKNTLELCLTSPGIEFLTDLNKFSKLT